MQTANSLAESYSHAWPADEPAGESTARNLALHLGHFAASAEVRLNGQLLAQVLTEDEVIALAPAARAGSNWLEVIVASALAQHFRAGSPTPYFDARQHRAGLYGPVHLLCS